MITANVSVDPQERPRVETQAQRILARLRHGPVEAGELVAMARQYNARVFELRAAGYRIECFDRNYQTGQTWYRLVDGEPVQLGMLT